MYAWIDSLIHHENLAQNYEENGAPSHKDGIDQFKTSKNLQGFSWMREDPWGLNSKFTFEWFFFQWRLLKESTLVTPNEPENRLEVIAPTLSGVYSFSWWIVNSPHSYFKLAERGDASPPSGFLLMKFLPRRQTQLHMPIWPTTHMQSANIDRGIGIHLLRGGIRWQIHYIGWNMTHSNRLQLCLHEGESTQ